jgi:hypothetical protein
MANKRKINCPNCGCKCEVDVETFDPEKYYCQMCGCLYSWSLKKQNEEKIKSNEHLSAQRSIYQSRNINRIKVRYKTNKKRLFSLLASFCLIIVIGICFAMIPVKNHDLKTNDKSSPKTTTSSTSLQKIPFPKNGYILYSSEKAVAPFTFEANNDESNIVILFDNDTKKRILQAFVNAGTIFKTKIPLGVYRMVIIHGGKNWYGFEKKFGHKTQYSESLKMLKFFRKDNSFRGHIIKMNKVVNGNMHLTSTNPIDIS